MTIVKYAMFLALLIFCIQKSHAESPSGKHQFVFDQWQGKPLNVWAYTPSNYAPNSKILFVMHGVKRDADRYRDEWVALAEQHNLLLIVPQFSQQDFPRALGYNLGNVFIDDKYQQANPPEVWAYSAIEPLFDYVKSTYANANNTYRLYGHSAGSQFVHRFIFFVPQARVSKIVSANAGWYTAPDFNIAFPYGLKNTMVTQDYLIASLQKPVVILLGEADNDPNDKYLRKAAPAMRQGPHRLARGEYFFNQTKQASQRYAVNFGWQLVTVPNVGHKNDLMANAAVAYLVDEEATPKVIVLK
jgi:poly(3-hydroxybutyrate) depolymerase